MHRASPVQHIPPGGVGRAEELCLEADMNRSVFHSDSDRLFSRLPSCATGRSVQDGNSGNPPVDNDRLKLRSSEDSAILAQVFPPGQCTADPGRNDTSPGGSPVRGYHRNLKLTAERPEVAGKVRVLQIVKDQVRCDDSREVLPPVFNDIGQSLIDIAGFNLEAVPSEKSDPPDLVFPASILLKNENALGLSFCTTVFHGVSNLSSRFFFAPFPDMPLEAIPSILIAVHWGLDARDVQV